MSTDNKPKRKRRPMRRVQVKSIEQLSPRMKRVTFSGEDLATFNWSGPASHVKLAFAGTGFDMPERPGPDDPRPPMRTYTPRRFDAEAQELDIEFVLHGHGIASTWADQAEVGQWLMVAGPGPGYQINEEADWYLIAADDTAIPAVSTILERLPANSHATVILEVSDAAEERTLPANGNVDTHWLHRGENILEADVKLEQAIRDFEMPSGTGQIYVGCEAGAMRNIRSYLLKERGLDRKMITTRGYWKIEAENHPDHDYGDD
ncbi:MAG: siderophore-interacting protein [Chloroflexota bacterium]